jgi:hypothetical protein
VVGMQSKPADSKSGSCMSRRDALTGRPATLSEAAGADPGCFTHAPLDPLIITALEAHSNYHGQRHRSVSEWVIDEWIAASQGTAPLTSEFNWPSSVPVTLLAARRPPPDAHNRPPPLTTAALNHRRP